MGRANLDVVVRADRRHRREAKSLPCLTCRIMAYYVNYAKSLRHSDTAAWHG
jgi:hypothetical protein